MVMAMCAGVQVSPLRGYDQGIAPRLGRRGGLARGDIPEEQQRSPGGCI